MAPPELVGWTPEDNKEELQRIANRDIDMAEANLGRYAALQTAEEECSCSCSGFYRGGMGDVGEAQGRGYGE
jgi:hypothetical protein